MLSTVLCALLLHILVVPTFFFFPTANTRKVNFGSGSVSNRPQDDCQICNHPIHSTGKTSLMLTSNAECLFGRPDVGKRRILSSWDRSVLSHHPSWFWLQVKFQGNSFPLLSTDHITKAFKNPTGFLYEEREGTTTKICVNVTVCYWKLCSASWRITAASPLPPQTTDTQTCPHTHTLSGL